MGIVDYGLRYAKMGETQMNHFLFSEPFFLVLNIMAYLAGTWLYTQFRFPLLHPLITATLLVGSYLGITKTSYQIYFENSQTIRLFLDLSVVALGYLLWEQVAHIKRDALAVLGACFIGSLTGVLSVVFTAWLMGGDSDIIASLQPKSVTTPIAMGISERFGGIPSLTAVLVVFCGILGSVVGPSLLNRCGIKSRLARGIAMGAASHGVGTARALQMGVLEGAAGGLAIAVMGVFTAICTAALTPLWRLMGVL